MEILRDEWSPLFRKLKSKVSVEGRRKLLFQMIGDLQDITMLNFGSTGIARPEIWKTLSAKYAREMKYGDRTPDLILSEEKHQEVNGGKPHLIDSFIHEIQQNSATLTNNCEYADKHQFGKGIPARPFYPITKDGSLTPFAEARQEKIIDEHFKD